MKKLSLVGLLILLLMLIVGCSQQIVEDDTVDVYSEIDMKDDIAGAYNETDVGYDIIDVYDETNYVQEEEIMVSEAIDFIEFSTLEDFLATSVATRADEEVADLVNHWSGSQDASSLEDIIENTELQSIRTLYLPIGIPENFEVRRVTVTEHYITFRYLPREITPVSREEFWSAMTGNPSFEFTIYRWQDMSDQMDIILEEENKSADDLINGKYLFLEPNMFIWESNGVLLTLYYTPGPSESDDEGRRSAPDMVIFAETREIDLQDINAVRDVIAEISNSIPT